MVEKGMVLSSNFNKMNIASEINWSLELFCVSFTHFSYALLDWCSLLFLTGAR